MQPESANVINLRTYRPSADANAANGQGPVPTPAPDIAAPAIERLAYHLLMAVRAAEEIP